MAEPNGTDQTSTFEQWAIVELMGHVRLAGRVSEESHFGSALGRIDIPGRDGTFVTQYFGGSSIYRVTPVDEEAARAVADANRPEPIHRWELPRPTAAEPVVPGDDVIDPDDDPDDYPERGDLW